METQNVISLSYGKDSLACFEACKILGIPVHRAIHAEVWATDTIPADLPPMMEFKKKADTIIKERYGITVEHISAMKPTGGANYIRGTVLHLKRKRSLWKDHLWIPYYQRCVVQQQT